MIKYFISRKLNKEMDGLIKDIMPAIKEGREETARGKIINLVIAAINLKTSGYIDANALEALLEKAENSYNIDTWDNYVRKWNYDMVVINSITNPEQILNSLFEDKDDEPGESL